MTIPTLLETITYSCLERRKLTISYYNIHSFNLSMQLPWFYDFLESSDIALCDSMGILGAIRYLGLDLPIDYRVSFSLLMPKLLERCNEQGFSIFLLGAKSKLLEIALEKIALAYPKIVLHGHHGYFGVRDPEQNAKVIRSINEIEPQILLVGMGSPIQEQWLYQNRQKLRANVLMAGGAVIDRLAGVVPNCPELLSNLSLEWLYRLCREPRRLSLRYLLGNPAFVLQVALAKSLAGPNDLLDIRPSRFLA
jgi:N-acetylglucosaminyldiphosphoundecaprenol N-acetyl-beta-D-mannosaminyltransferase